MGEHQPHIQDLVRNAQTGDSESIAELFRLFSDRIFRFVRYRVGDVATAEDLTQTVFVEMIRSLPRYKEQKNAKFSTWLFQIARFRLIDHYRSRRNTVSLDHDVPDGTEPQAPVIHEESALIDRALAHLPERYQTVLHLTFHEDLDDKEIATILRIGKINVRVLRHRALRALRAYMNDNHPSFREP